MTMMMSFCRFLYDECTRTRPKEQYTSRAHTIVSFNNNFVFLVVYFFLNCFYYLLFLCVYQAKSYLIVVDTYYFLYESMYNERCFIF